MTIADEQFHAILRALSDPRRFAILEQVAAQDSITCARLREQEIISPATISHHVKELVDAGLIDRYSESRYTVLTLKRDVWTAYCKRLASL